ncbi:hypothetical protein KUTeg_002741 [Tegillarca granosa]|uniref:Uncharacterized protein n=1 Tax=Tegillarca granosa TaxID=220873 RepID=A0ABQ9FR12_TEGGR|nr:hypothetical protein KUTeg_022453 [Tegillarca granosa]KAJ8319698.1 hypothetical protein KUTeg_002741 [Tegillarca granosa]
MFDAIRPSPGCPLETFHSQILETDKLAFFIRAGNIQSYEQSSQQAKPGEAYGYCNSSPNPVAAAVTTNGNFSKISEKISDRLYKLEKSITKSINFHPKMFCLEWKWACKAKLQLANGT